MTVLLPEIKGRSCEIPDVASKGRIGPLPAQDPVRRDPSGERVRARPLSDEPRFPLEDTFEDTAFPAIDGRRSRPGHRLADGPGFAEATGLGLGIDDLAAGQGIPPEDQVF